MLEVGNGGLTLREERTHFALWAFAKAPLIIGCDLTKVSAESLAILKAKELIKLNQDSLGQQMRCVQNCSWDSTITSYVSYQKDHEKDGYYGLLVVNWSDYYEHSTTVDLVKAGIAPSKEYMCYFIDLWTNEQAGSARQRVNIIAVPPRGSVSLKVLCF